MATTISKSTSLDALRDRVSAALRDKLPDKGANGGYVDGPWIRDMFMTSVVYNYDGTLYSASFTDKNKVITIGEPTKVEVAYKPLKESVQGVVLGKESTDIVLLEAKSYDKKNSTLNITVIKPGFNKSRSRYYPASMLKRDHKVFDGAKMMVNHATAQEAKARPEGSVHDWVASMGSTFVEADGTVKAKAKVIDPAFKAKLDLMDEHGLLPQLGVSIRAAGGAQEAIVDNVKTNYVESIKVCKTVDFVTFAGAGGGVDGFSEAFDGLASFDELVALQEAAEDGDIDTLSLDVFRSKRPDLVALITQEAQETFEMAKTVEELERELAESNRKNADLETKIAESDKATKRANTATALTTKLAEAKLPDFAADRIRSQFKEAESADGIDAAITAEREYLAKTGFKESETSEKGKGKVKGLGVQESAAKGDEQEDLQESAAAKDRLVAAYQKAGHTKERAVQMAESALSR